MQTMTYPEALKMAMDGKVAHAILDAMRQEYVSAESSGADSYKIDIKINLAVALMQLGNKSPDPAEYSAMYQESEDALLSILELNSGHVEAEKNLAIVRKNKLLRQSVGKSKSNTVSVPVGTLSASQYENHDSHLISYDEALQRAMRGAVDFNVISAMRDEHSRAINHPGHLTAVKVNLGVALLHLANEMESNDVDAAGYAMLYKESEELFESALALDPNNKGALSNLLIARRNLLQRDRFVLFNPHVTMIGHNSCNLVLIRRLNVQKLASTLFTCDGLTDRGLLWTSESEDIEVQERKSVLGASRSLRLHHFPAYDSRSLMWKHDLCWISSAGGWTKGNTNMHFHCVPKDRFLDEMERSHQAQQLLPLMHARGGEILADRENIMEKNWSPFVADGVLYITYSCRPLIVMRCDWEDKQELLQCQTVQNTASSELPFSLPHIKAAFRGSSTSVSLGNDGSEFLALGHVKGKGKNAKYHYFFYKFSGRAPPFEMHAFSPLFSLPTEDIATFDYAHGICVVGSHLIITYGVNDDTSWQLKVDLQEVLDLFLPEALKDRSDFAALSHDPPKEFSAMLFGKPVEQVLSEQENLLKRSTNKITIEFLAFMSELPLVSVDRLLRQHSQLRQSYINTNAALIRAEMKCGVTPDSSVSASSTCRNQADVLRIRDDAQNSFWAYVSFLSRENKIVGAMIESGHLSSMLGVKGVQDRTDAHAEKSLGEKGHRVRGGREAQERAGFHRQSQESPTGLSYSEALALAMNGQLSTDVVSAMRREHSTAERSAVKGHLVDVKVNLAVALQQMGNQSPNPVEYTSMYEECEKMLLSALSLDPAHAGAQKNLVVVRKNRSQRPVPAGGPSSDQARGDSKNPHLPTPAAQNFPVEQDHAAQAQHVSAEPKARSALSYDNALQLAIRGDMSVEIVEAMRAEHFRAVTQGPVHHLVQVTVNLAAALINLANKVDARLHVQYILYYKESEKMLEYALGLDPGNENVLRNLDVVRRNLGRDKFALFNPHLTEVQEESCSYILLRRLVKDQLFSTLFTCDKRKDRGLLWTYESEEVDERQWNASFASRRYFPRAPAHDARSLLWNEDLCWITSAWDLSRIYMLFHCVPLDRFLAQMSRSHQTQQLLPLLHARGGAIIADRAGQVEKNWSPFVVDGVLYMTYSCRPHVVMRCDWGKGTGLLECRTVQDTPSADLPPLPPSFGDGRATLRGSSTAVALPSDGEPEFLAMGHTRSKDAARAMVFRFFLYGFRGRAPPFRVTGFGPLFTLPRENASRFQYAHGLSVEGDRAIIAFGVDDESAWYVSAPLADLAGMAALGAPPRAAPALADGLARLKPRRLSDRLFGEGLEQHLDGLPDLLRASERPLAADFLAFLEAIPEGTLEDYAAGVYRFRQALRRAAAAQERLEAACDSGEAGGAEDLGPGPGEGACAGLEAARADALAAFRAYTALLSRENGLVGAIAGRTFDRAH